MSRGVAFSYSRDDARQMAERVLGYMTAGEATVAVSSDLPASTEFAQGEVLRASNSVERNVSFYERFDRRAVAVDTDAFDDASLKATVAKAEGLARGMTVEHDADANVLDPLRPPAAENARLWSESSVGLTAPDARLAVIERTLEAATAAGVVASGVLEAAAETAAVLTKDGHFEYGRISTCTYSITARTPDGTGSGWAGWTGEDWSTANVDALTARAIDLAERSRNPVAVEPGRWTVVMTPEACGALVQHIANVVDGPSADRGGTPFSKDDGGNKIGLKVLDERVTLSIDPMDAEGGFLPFEYVGRSIAQFVPVTWVEHGVLKTLAYGTRVAAESRGLEPLQARWDTLRMSGGTTSIEEMIAQTPRGIYVTRFSDVSVVSRRTLYMTGSRATGRF
jgi:predicted Zn-dependent protease